MNPPEDPPDETTWVNEQGTPDPPHGPVTVEEPGIDFEAMLGSYQDLALYVVVGGDDDGDHRPRPRVGRYERRDP